MPPRLGRAGSGRHAPAGDNDMYVSLPESGWSSPDSLEDVPERLTLRGVLLPRILWQGRGWVGRQRKREREQEGEREREKKKRREREREREKKKERGGKERGWLCFFAVSIRRGVHLLRSYDTGERGRAWTEHNPLPMRAKRLVRALGALTAKRHCGGGYPNQYPTNTERKSQQYCAGEPTPRKQYENGGTYASETDAHTIFFVLRQLRTYREAGLDPPTLSKYPTRASHGLYIYKKVIVQEAFPAMIIPMPHHLPPTG